MLVVVMPDRPLVPGSLTGTPLYGMVMLSVIAVGGFALALRVLS